MAQTNEDNVAKLLQQGLELYGTGEIPRAFMLWNEALELDPGNEEALDYIRDADRRHLRENRVERVLLPSFECISRIAVGAAQRTASESNENSRTTNGARLALQGVENFG